MVAQPVAEEVKAQNTTCNGRRREENQVRRVKQTQTRIVEHRSPTRCRRRDSEPEKGERCFSKNYSCHADSCLHQNGLHDARQNVADEVAPSFAPRARAASTYSRSRTAITCARTSRAYPAYPQLARARTRLVNPGPKKAANAIAKRMFGSARNVFMANVVSALSTHPARIWRARRLQVRGHSRSGNLVICVWMALL